MKRHQIRQLIGRDTCTDAQLRKAIAELNLPTEDDLDYGDRETQAIIQKFKPAQAKSPQLPNLQQRPQHPSSHQPTADRHSQSLPSAPLDRINQQRQEAAGAIVNRAGLAQQTAIQDVKSLAESAHVTAQAIAYQKALVISSFPALVDEYANQYLNQIDDLQSRAQSGFTSGIDFQAWTEELTELAFPAFAPSVGALKGAKPAPLPETK